METTETITREWRLPKLTDERVTSLAEAMGVSYPVASVYACRLVDTKEEVEDFIRTDAGLLHDPYLLPDMRAAVERLKSAIDRNEQVMVWGDYDADGITATALMASALRQFGARVQFGLPDRYDGGYGLRIDDVRAAKEAGGDLLITADCGSSDILPALVARDIGIDLIITDHHQPTVGSVDVVANVNPTRKGSEYPFDGLAGVGVALKVIMALAEKLGRNPQGILDQFAGFAALGTVADAAPMVDENRFIVSYGCERMRYSTKPGIQQLIKDCGVKRVDTEAIRFYLAPRLNAAGRMGGPAPALDLLMEENPARARYLAFTLGKLNKERRAAQEEITAEALKLLPPEDEQGKVIIVAGRDWQWGLLGPVAGQLSRMYGKPAVVCSVENGVAKGSCRSIPSYDIHKALQSCSDLLITYGGHPLAAGVELPSDNLPELAQRLNEFKGFGSFPCPVHLDAKLPAQLICEATYQHVMRLAPFGTQNPVPLFLTEGLTIGAKTLIEDGKHLKLSLYDRDPTSQHFQAVRWNCCLYEAFLQPGITVDVVYRLGLDDFKNRKSLLLTIEDMRLSKCR